MLNTAAMTTQELIVLREALTDYTVLLRTDHATGIVRKKDANINDYMTPHTADLYIAACDLKETVKNAIARRL